jgi:hypothetical protein
VTQLHPNILGALSALADLADQHRWLAEHLEPGPQRRHARTLGPAARISLNRLHRAERADLTETLRAGLYPFGTGRAPINLDASGASALGRDVTVDAAWLCLDAIHTHPDAPPAYTCPGVDEAEQFDHAVTYLRDALLLVHPDLAGTLGAALNAAANMCGHVTRSGPDRTPLPGFCCPACGVRSLKAQTTSMFEEAIITCSRSDCRCRGVDCLCRKPTRAPLQRHMWRSDEDPRFAQLAALLGRQAA